MAYILWPERRLRRQAHRTILCIFLGLLFIRTIRDKVDERTQERPVDFSVLHERGQQTLRQPQKPLRWFNGSHIDGRYHLQRTLKAGNQGSVYLYQDVLSIPPKLVIVKTISEVARNKLPAQLVPTFGDITSTWPSEIDASLSVAVAALEDASPYVPVHDYFILRDSSSSERDWTWTLVTPFISYGTLDDLAKVVRSVGRTADIDQAYRPTFDHLLKDLRSLHDQGFCHDDVKPQNIFVQSPSRWLLGDLGNAREIDHAWHGTRLWRRRNQWSNCRLNDVRRALKSYLSFLRDASHDREQFDVDFLMGATEWARMYWSFVQSPSAWTPSVDAGNMSTSETRDERPTPDGGLSTWYGICVDSSLRAAVVKQELHCTSLWWKLCCTL